MIFSETLFLAGGKRSAFLFILSSCTLIAILISAATFVADRQAGIALRGLDDPETEHLDTVDLSVDTLQAFDDAIAAYKLASAFAPLNAGYEKKAGELYFRLALWRETMLKLEAVVPDVIAGKEPLRSAALDHLSRAVYLDPANAEMWLGLGQMLVMEGMKEKAQVQFMNAIRLYPVNSEIRYAVAMQYLTAGMTADAREQAVILARNDDSYRVDENDRRMTVAREQRLPWYEERLSSSYLYKAMEILWRTGGKDLDTLLASVPDNVDAKEVKLLFLEQKDLPGSLQRSEER